MTSDEVDWPMSLRVLCATITTAEPTEDPAIIDIADDVYTLAINRAYWRQESDELYSAWSRVWYYALAAASEGIDAWD